MKKLLMYNEKTGKVLTTEASVNGPIYAGYLANGFKPLCYVVGFNVGARSFSDEELVTLGISK